MLAAADGRGRGRRRRQHHDGQDPQGYPQGLQPRLQTRGQADRQVNACKLDVSINSNRPQGRDPGPERGAAAPGRERGAVHAQQPRVVRDAVD